ncbi:MAG TPA: hypothetical protein DIV86_05515 [Alphaproteobacteria bacterium]|nr:hypothetical protein [Alphaproteobacteria bacterium]
MQQLITDINFLIILGLVFGLIFGSFATALIYRMPRNIDWVFKRSECTKCHHKLGVIELVPVFYYLFSGGRCRKCKTKFGANYLIVEILTVSFFLFGLIYFGLTLEGVTFCLLSFSILVLSAIDFEHYIIPDEVNFFIAVLGAVYSGYNSYDMIDIIFMPFFCFIFALLLRLIMFAWKKREGLGFGDVKFFFSAGFFLHFETFPLFLMMSGLIGVVIAIIWKLRKKGELFPFGPALGLSLLFCYVFSEIGSITNNIVQKFI